MKKHLLLLLLIIPLLFNFFYCSENTKNKAVVIQKTPEQIRADSIRRSDSLMFVNLSIKYNIKKFTNAFYGKNPNWLNNSATIKEGNEKFQLLLVENFNEIVKYNKFKLKNILVSNKKISVHLSPKDLGIWGSIVGTLDKSVDVNSLKEDYIYYIIGGDFVKFITPEMAADLTGWSIWLETDVVGVSKDKDFYIGSSYWKNLKLKIY